jgi:hypothetical protein
MSAFPNTGRSDWWILAILSGRFRPKAVTERCRVKTEFDVCCSTSDCVVNSNAMPPRLPIRPL